MHVDRTSRFALSLKRFPNDVNSITIRKALQKSEYIEVNATNPNLKSCLIRILSYYFKHDFRRAHQAQLANHPLCRHLPCGDCFDDFSERPHQTVTVAMVFIAAALLLFGGILGGWYLIHQRAGSQK